MFKVVDRLVSDMDDINNYFSNIVLPVTVLLPQKIAKCTEEDAENLCATFPGDLKDPDTLRAELEMMGNDIEKSGAKNLRSVYSEDNVLGRILWHDIVQFRCPGSGTTLKHDK